jgi:hypothetical protein
MLAEVIGRKRVGGAKAVVSLDSSLPLDLRRKAEKIMERVKIRGFAPTEVTKEGEALRIALVVEEVVLVTDQARDGYIEIGPSGFSLKPGRMSEEQLRQILQWK